MIQTIYIKNAVSTRSDAYHIIAVLSYCINNSFSSCIATEASVKTMQSLTDKVHDARIGTLPTLPVPKPDYPMPDAPKTISVSQMSFDNRRANFNKETAFVSVQSKYNPNEAYLKVPTLTPYVKYSISALLMRRCVLL